MKQKTGHPLFKIIALHRRGTKMNRINIEPILDFIEDVVKRHYLGDGKYANWLWQDSNNTRQLGYNAYGCADAANILYTLDRFEEALNDSEKRIKALQGKQDKDTGIFIDATHHDFHTTAHCIAALELYNAKPLYPLTAMMPYTNNVYVIISTPFYKNTAMRIDVSP